jgi:tetratricopeptide (TPR) repeat protein
VWALVKQGETAAAYDQAEAQRLEADRSTEAARLAAKQADLQRQRAEKHLSLAAQLAQARPEHGAEKYYRSAVAVWEQVVADRPEEANFRTSLFQAYQGHADALAQQRRFRDAARDIHRAIAVLQQLVRDFPNDPRAVASDGILSDFHSKLGEYSRSAGDFPQAAKAYQLALAYWQDPKLRVLNDRHGPIAELQIRLGKTFLGSGDLPAAEGAFTQALAEIKLMPATFLRQRGWYWTAQAQFGLGEVFRARQQPAQAENAFRLALAAREEHARIHPIFLNAKLELAWLLATCPDVKVRDPARAIEVARQALDQARAAVDRESVGKAETTLGLAYFRTGDWKNAWEQLEKAKTRSRNDDGVIGFLRVMIDWHRGNHKDARQGFDSLARSMDQGQVLDAQLLPFRAEAAALLGVKDRRLDPKAKSHQNDKR